MINIKRSNNKKGMRDRKIKAVGVIEAGTKKLESRHIVFVLKKLS